VATEEEEEELVNTIDTFNRMSEARGDGRHAMTSQDGRWRGERARTNRRGVWAVASLRLVLVAAAIAVFVAPTASAQLNQPFHQDGWILAAAHTPGLHGSIWRTDLWVHVHTLSGGRVTLYFCKSGEDNTEVTGYDVPYEEGSQVYYFEDVVDHFLKIGDDEWVGAIHYTADPEAAVWARVYSVSPDGGESYGQLVVGIPTVDMSPDDDPWDYRQHQWMYATKHTADDRFRVNVGIVNPTQVPSHYIVRMVGTKPSDGNLAVVEADVPPMSMVQLSDPFRGVEDGEWNNHQIGVICATEGAGGFGYASVVDNSTNDAYFVRGVKFLPPSD